MLEVRNLNFSYPNGAGKLENVNLKKKIWNYIYF